MMTFVRSYILTPISPISHKLMTCPTSFPPSQPNFIVRFLIGSCPHLTCESSVLKVSCLGCFMSNLNLRYAAKRTFQMEVTSHIYGKVRRPITISPRNNWILRILQFQRQALNSWQGLDELEGRRLKIPSFVGKFGSPGLMVKSQSSVIFHFDVQW